MALEDALNKGDEKLNDASTEMAKLGGIPGRGTLQVVRAQSGEVLEVLGTWLLADDRDVDTSRLERAFEANERVTYQGKLDDPEHPEQNEIELEVRITSVQDYTFDQQQYREENATKKRLYSFMVEGSLPYL